LLPATTYLIAQRLRSLVMHDLDQVSQTVDFLVTPTAETPAPKLDPGPSEIGAPTGAPSTKRVCSISPMPYEHSTPWQNRHPVLYAHLPCS
jgi:Asp-tRNA(Asn)/Glu-tRNA(Gln) amidotransferase A subunit family amidase